MDNYEYCLNTMKIEKNFHKDFDNRIKQLCEDFCDQAEESEYWLCFEHFSRVLISYSTTLGLTDEEKRRAVTERNQMAAEYGSDFESIQKYCIEKIIKRNSSVNSSIIGKVQSAEVFSASDQ